MGKRFDFEYIVIGGGTTGKTAALTLARVGKKVALVEQDRWGGSELNYRDVPYAACLGFSHLYHKAKTGKQLGVSGEIKYDWRKLSDWRDEVILAAGGDSKKELEKAGVVCLNGKARFMGPYDIVLDEKKKTSAGKFLVATGSVLNVGGIVGTQDVDYLTPATALRLETPPEAVMVIGAGSSGCEIAEYFAEIGAKVVLAEAKDKILPREDAEVGQVMEQYFVKRLGMKVLTGTRVTKMSKDGNDTVITFNRDNKEKTVKVDTVVLATGCVPATHELGLKDAGVSFDKTGIIVDRTLQTSARHIFAAGDVLGGESSPERAVYIGQIVAGNMLGKTKGAANYDGFARITSTYPEIAVTGFTENELVKKNRKYNKVLVPLSDIRASIVNDFSTGFVKMLADNSGKVLGATIVAPNASEMLQEISMAVRHGLSVLQIASTPHITGTWSDAVKLAAKKLVK